MTRYITIDVHIVNEVICDVQLMKTYTHRPHSDGSCRQPPTADDDVTDLVCARAAAAASDDVRASRFLLFLALGAVSAAVTSLRSRRLQASDTQNHVTCDVARDQHTVTCVLQRLFGKYM